jgi:hypothetical protein
MTTARGFLTILLGGLAFALGGGLIGLTLGVVLPGYYRAVFSSGREPWFDPIAVGLGLGLTQGLILGVVAGAVVVLAVAWYGSRRRVVDEEFGSLPSGGHTQRLSAEDGITSRPGH